MLSEGVFKKKSTPVSERNAPTVNTLQPIL